jgi:phage terminase small subunit
MGAKQTRDQDGLTDLERRFATYYLEEFNGTKAYTQASARKVTKKTAEVSSYKMLRRPAVQAFVKAQRDKLLDKAELSVGDTLTKLRQLLMYDIRNIFGPDGTPLRVQDLDDDTAAAIVGIKVVTKGNAEMGIGQVMELKLADKNSTLEKALKYHGLFERDHKQQADALKEITIKLVKAAGGS